MSSGTHSSIRFEKLNWAESAAVFIQKLIEDLICKPLPVNVMLTGGSTARDIYQHWGSMKGFQSLNKEIHFYFGDERAVPESDINSNFGMTMKSLFRNKIPLGATVHPMVIDQNKIDESARKYSSILPEHIDLLIITAGNDGHIASIFPKSNVLKEKSRSIVPVVGGMPFCQRLTITPLVINRARNIVVLAPGKTREAALLKIKAGFDCGDMPVSLVYPGIWILSAE